MNDFVLIYRDGDEVRLVMHGTLKQAARLAQRLNARILGYLDTPIPDRKAIAREVEKELLWASRQEVHG